MTDAPILEMLNISKVFGGVQALRDVSFSCRRGKVHALLGENGAGKSTLIKILAGAYQADSGEIVFRGRRYAGFTAREAMATGISIIYQELNLVQFMTVAENIFLGREPRNRFGVIDTRRMAKESANLLDRLGAGRHPPAQRVWEFLAQRVGDLIPERVRVVELHDTQPRPRAVRGRPRVALDRDDLVASPGESGAGEQPGRACSDDCYSHDHHSIRYTEDALIASIVHLTWEPVKMRTAV